MNPEIRVYRKLWVLIEELVRKIPMAEKLLEIKGVGIRTVSGFLAEVGDISRFNNPKELQKLAELALVEKIVRESIRERQQ